jgi:hypothetical protein
LEGDEGVVKEKKISEFIRCGKRVEWKEGRRKK